jgi:hypothetical protein
MSASYAWPVASIPMCDSDAAGSRPRRRSSALARTARSCALGDSPGAAGHWRAAQAVTVGSAAA